MEILNSFLGWLVLLSSLLFAIAFVFTSFENDISTSDRILRVIGIVIFGALSFLGFRLLRFRKKQEKDSLIYQSIISEEKPKVSAVLQPIENPEKVETPKTKKMESPEKAEKPIKKKIKKKPTPYNIGKGIYRIVYIDGDGDSSKRDIKIIRLEHGNPAYIYAYCFLRNKNRSFRVDRIVAVYKDGEAIKNPTDYLLHLDTEQLAVAATEELNTQQLAAEALEE